MSKKIIGVLFLLFTVQQALVAMEQPGQPGRGVHSKKGPRRPRPPMPPAAAAPLWVPDPHYITDPRALPMNFCPLPPPPWLAQPVPYGWVPMPPQRLMPTANPAEALRPATNSFVPQPMPQERNYFHTFALQDESTRDVETIEAELTALVEIYSDKGIVQQDTSGCTPIHLAVHHGRVVKATAMINKVANERAVRSLMRLRTSDGVCILYSALKKLHTSIARAEDDDQTSTWVDFITLITPYSDIWLSSNDDVSSKGYFDEFLAEAPACEALRPFFGLFVAHAGRAAVRPLSPKLALPAAVAAGAGDAQGGAMVGAAATTVVAKNVSVSPRRSPSPVVATMAVVRPPSPTRADELIFGDPAPEPAPALGTQGVASVAVTHSAPAAPKTSQRAFSEVPVSAVPKRSNHLPASFRGKVSGKASGKPQQERNGEFERAKNTRVAAPAVHPAEGPAVVPPKRAVMTAAEQREKERLAQVAARKAATGACFDNDDDDDHKDAASESSVPVMGSVAAGITPSVELFAAIAAKNSKQLVRWLGVRSNKALLHGKPLWNEKGQAPVYAALAQGFHAGAALLVEAVPKQLLLQKNRDKIGTPINFMLPHLGEPEINALFQTWYALEEFDSSVPWAPGGPSIEEYARSGGFLTAGLPEVQTPQALANPPARRTKIRVVRTPVEAGEGSALAMASREIRLTVLLGRAEWDRKLQEDPAFKEAWLNGTIDHDPVYGENGTLENEKAARELQAKNEEAAQALQAAIAQVENRGNAVPSINPLAGINFLRTAMEFSGEGSPAELVKRLKSDKAFRIAVWDAGTPAGMPRDAGVAVNDDSVGNPVLRAIHVDDIESLREHDDAVRALSVSLVLNGIYLTKTLPYYGALLQAYEHGSVASFVYILSKIEDVCMPIDLESKCALIHLMLMPTLVKSCSQRCEHALKVFCDRHVEMIGHLCKHPTFNVHQEIIVRTPTGIFPFTPLEHAVIQMIANGIRDELIIQIVGMLFEAGADVVTGLDRFFIDLNSVDMRKYACLKKYTEAVLVRYINAQPDRFLERFNHVSIVPYLLFKKLYGCVHALYNAGKLSGQEGRALLMQSMELERDGEIVGNYDALLFLLDQWRDDTMELSERQIIRDTLLKLLEWEPLEQWLTTIPSERQALIIDGVDLFMQEVAVMPRADG